MTVSWHPCLFLFIHMSTSWFSVLTVCSQQVSVPFWLPCVPAVAGSQEPHVKIPLLGGFYLGAPPRSDLCRWQLRGRHHPRFTWLKTERALAGSSSFLNLLQMPQVTAGLQLWSWGGLCFGSYYTFVFSTFLGWNPPLNFALQPLMMIFKQPNFLYFHSSWNI